MRVIVFFTLYTVVLVCALLGATVLGLYMPELLAKVSTAPNVQQAQPVQSASPNQPK